MMKILKALDPVRQPETLALKLHLLLRLAGGNFHKPRLKGR